MASIVKFLIQIPWQRLPAPSIFIRIEGQMSAKGCFSYENDTINGFNIGDNLQLRVERVNNNVAAVTVTDGNGTQLPAIPSHIKLRDAAGVNVPPYNNAFLITWVDSYTIQVGGVDTVWIMQQKQQAFTTAAGITHFTV